MENHKLECYQHTLGQEFMRAKDFIIEQVSSLRQTFKNRHKYALDRAKSIG